MYLVPRAFSLIFKHRRDLWGIPGLSVSYVFASIYVAMVSATFLQAPLVAGIAYGASAVIEASDILPESRAGRRLSDWRRGLDVRSQWRLILFIAAMAASSADGALLVAFGAVALATNLGIRLIRNPVLGLATDRHVRPLGALGTGADRLALAQGLARRRDLTELPLQISVAAAGLLLSLPAGTAFPVAFAIGAAAAVAFAALTYAAAVGLRCRQLRPVLLQGAHDTEVIDGFRAFDPEVLCYFNGHRRSLYAVNVWLRTFEECGRRVALVFRHNDVKDVPTDRLPGIVVTKDSLVEQLVTPSTRVALYPANGTLNIQLLRDNRLTHVFIGHGDSDKVGSARQFARVYDRIWVSGQAGADRYPAAGIDIPANRFDVVGRPPLSPKLRALEREAATVEGELGPYERVIAELAEVDDGSAVPTTILYAPTWEGYFEDANYSSLEVMGTELIETILEHLPLVRVIFKPHPLSGHRNPGAFDAIDEIRSLLEKADAYHAASTSHGEVQLYDWFDHTDLLIGDISSVVSDFLMWDRPYAITNPKRLSASEMGSQFPSTRSAYVLEPDARLMATVLDGALTHDPLGRRRHDARTYFLGDPDRDPLDMFREQLDIVYDTKEPAGLIREDPI
jgi:hypothetical protein